MLGQLQERRAGGREFQILVDATEKLRAPNNAVRVNAVCLNETVSRLVLDELKRLVTLLNYSLRYINNFIYLSI